MNKFQCPVCGYDEVLVNDEADIPSYEKCNSCGYLSGYDYKEDSSLKHFQTLRNKWVLGGIELWSGASYDKPKGWSPFAQMKRAGFSYPLIPTLMAFHHLGLIDDDYTKNWADRHMEAKHDDIDALVIISMHGMPRGIKYHDYRFPLRRAFNFSEEFALRTQKLDHNNYAQSQEYIAWVAKNCLGEDIDLPEVSFGYQLDDYLERNINPYDYMLTKIDDFKKLTAKLNNDLWDEIK